LEQVSSIADYKPLKKCPGCGKNTLFRVYSGVGIIINGNPTTVGKLAEENTKKLGRYGLEEKIRQDAEKRIKKSSSKLPPGMRRLKKEAPLGKEKIKRLKKIAGMSPEQKQKYVHEGKIV